MLQALLTRIRLTKRYVIVGLRPLFRFNFELIKGLITVIQCLAWYSHTHLKDRYTLIEQFSSNVD